MLGYEFKLLGSLLIPILDLASRRFGWGDIFRGLIVGLANLLNGLEGGRVLVNIEGEGSCDEIQEG